MRNKLIISCMFVLCFFVTNNFSFAMSELKDNDLEKITGQAGFSSITRNGNLIRLMFNTKIETYAELGSLKAGYYYRADLSGSDGQDLYQLRPNIALGLVVLRGPQDPGWLVWEHENNPNHTDWDQDWRNLKMGNSASDPVTMNGLVIRAEYDNVDSPNRKLTRFVIGSPDMNGPVSASMVRMSGVCNPQLMSGFMGWLVKNSGTLLAEKFELTRDSLLTKGSLELAAWPFRIPAVPVGEYQFTGGKGQGFFLELTKEKGIRAIMGYNENGQ